MPIRYIPEEISRNLVSHELALEATARAYLAAATPNSVTFPVVICHGGDPSNRFSIKSASAGQIAGAKIGSYWPHNKELRRPPHNSCILLFDQSVGRIDTLIEASAANGYRTAAGNAIAVKHLARKDASHLSIFGAGYQASFECEAVIKVLSIRSVSIVSRDAERGRQLARRLKGVVEARVTSAKDACRGADIIVTVTASQAPLFDSEWVKPGTHISCMGADAPGKQELPRDLLLRSELFCDLLQQSVVIGEFQHIAAAIKNGLRSPVNIGDVIAGRALGRQSADAITIFDSSGLALQDLYLGQLLLEAAEQQHLISTLDP